ncbi:MAG: extracellular solute-binding protein, partial [Muribaculum sp.]|nr:extracellular solute-binding protein [Muribaculum sp.]
MKKQGLWIMMTLCLALAGCGGKEPAEAESKTLTLATFRGESSSLVQWVNQYNEKHPDITIETVNYQERYPDPYEAINQIKIEVSAGKGPDLIDFGSLYSPLDASCGMMADLYPLMQADETFDEQDYTVNILKAFAVGDSLYALVPSYTIDTYATVNEELAGLSRMDIWQLVDAYDKLDEESILFPGETKLAVFGMICFGSLGNYIDWAAGTCDFDSDSFKELLLFANRFPLNLNIDNDYSAKTIFA